MGMSRAARASARDDDRSAETIRTALDLGMTLVDTADCYGDGHNEELVGRAIAGRRSEVVIATKVGLVVDDPQTKQVHRDGSPEHVEAAVDASLRRLGIDTIDLCYLHRIDPAVPLAETWAAMAALVTAGKVRRLGLSEVTVAEADQAQHIHPVTAIQSELSLWTKAPLVRTSSAGTLSGSNGHSGDSVVGWCAAQGAAFVASAPLGQGFLSGTVSVPHFDTSDLRATMPRFQRGALMANLRIVDVIRAVADRVAATPAQIALAWVLAQGDHVIAIPGTKNPRYVRENAAAARIALCEDDLTMLAEVPDPVGGRY